MQGLLLQVNVSSGGLPKRPVPEALLTPLGLRGDSSRPPRSHPNPREAVLLLASEVTEELIARGYPVFHGAAGENLTIQGIDFSQLRLGMQLRCGQAVLELTAARRPDHSLDIYGAELKRLLDPRGVAEGSPAWGRSGFWASVVEPGWVHAGDPVTVLSANV